MPWSWRRLQGEDGRDNGLRSHSTSGAREEYQGWAAPCQRCCLPPPEGLVGIRVHERHPSFLREDLHGWIFRDP